MTMFQNSVLKSFTQNESLDLKSQINQTDKEIDAMVYTLYDLTDEEIKIVEGK
ncbi:MAG: hypothetical protein GX170_07725 [Campylobacteraceae bacterium]|nr:hypothetical protein [Campylobacteraceae bacterium]